MAFEKIGTKSDIPAGTVKVFEVNGVSVCVGNLDGAEFYAIDNLCTHDNGPLEQGELDGEQIECPRHGARFDVTSGRATQLPAFEPVETHEVRVEGDSIQVGVDHQ